jgi:hypothetical protein
VNAKTRPVPTEIQGPVTVQGSVTLSNTPNGAVVAMPSLAIGGEVGVRDLDAGHRDPVTITLNGSIAPAQTQTPCPTTL